MRPASQKGASLIEVVVGISLLSFLIIGGLRLTNNSRRANTLGQDLSGSAALLNTFIENIHTVNISDLQKNREVRDSLTGGAIITYEVFDNTSTLPYRQPVGLYLVNAKLTWTRWGRAHTLETSALLTDQ